MSDLSLQAVFTLAILIGALILLASQRLRVGLVALLVMIALMAGRVLTPAEAFSALGRRTLLPLLLLFLQPPLM